MQYFRAGGFPVVFLCFAVGSGCGGDANLPELGEVTGVVTLDDKPAEGLTVTFEPQDTRPSSGETDAEGRYVLYYNPDNRGAALGEHTVRITELEKEGEPGAETQLIPPEYNVESTLKKQVKPGPNEINFDLKWK